MAYRQYVTDFQPSGFPANCFLTPRGETLTIVTYVIENVVLEFLLAYLSDADVSLIGLGR